MKATTLCGPSLVAALLAGFASWACGASGPSADDLNQNTPPGSGGSGTTPQGGSAGSGTAGGGGSGSTSTTGGSGTGGSVTPGGGSAGSGSGGTGPMGGAGPTGGTGSGGGGGSGDVGPYGDRSGSFKMLVLTRTKAFRHDGSINTGRTMLEAIAAEQGFELTFAGSAVKAGASSEEINALSDAEVAAAITAENLAKYEIIFHLNTTGDVYNAQQQVIFEDWMTQKNGAFAGVHAATDTENGWAFYSEVTGEYYDTHTSVTTGTIEFEPTMATHPAVKGLPNPWTRQEEWYKFDEWQTWSQKPGFHLLSKRTGVTEHNVPTAFMWVREWGNFRSFYTALGHDSVVFQDPNVKKHVTGGIMWAVRRGHLIK